MDYNKKTKILTIIEHGAHISKNLDYFMVKTKENKTRFLAKGLKKIIILNSFSITKGAILLSMFNDVRIMALSRHGSPLFSIMSLRTEDSFLKLLMKRINMTEYQRTKLSRLFVENAIKGKLSFLRYKKSIFLRTDKKKAKQLEMSENKIMELWKQTKHIKGRWTEQKKNLFSVESHASNVYFSCFKLIFSKDVYVGKRDKNGKDLVNICLNYAYGVLCYHIFYKLIDNAINPFNSIYHYQEDKVKMFLVFDLMEGLRHTVCDWTVHSLINRKQIKPSDIEDDFLKMEKRIEIISLVGQLLAKKECHLNKALKLISKFSQ